MHTHLAVVLPSAGQLQSMIVVLAFNAIGVTTPQVGMEGMDVSAGRIRPGLCFFREDTVCSIAAVYQVCVCEFGIPGHGVFSAADVKTVHPAINRCAVYTRFHFGEILAGEGNGAVKLGSVLTDDFDVASPDHNCVGNRVDTAGNCNGSIAGYTAEIKHNQTRPSCVFSI